MFKKLITGLALVAAAGAAQAGYVFQENFDNVASLAGKGWSLQNLSSPVGPTGWFQGNSAVFPAYNGAPNAYIGANYLNGAANAGGNINNWLLSPQFNYGANETLTFALRLESGLGFFDTVQVYYSTTGASTNVASFIQLASYTSTADTGWVVYSLALPVTTGSGRIGFRYTVPNTDTAGDYIGIDAVAVVPEPSSIALAGVALLALGLSRRSPRRSTKA